LPILNDFNNALKMLCALLNSTQNIQVVCVELGLSLQMFQIYLF